MIFQLFSVVEETPAVVRSHNSKLSILTEVDCRYQLSSSIHLVPEKNFLVGDVPKSQAAIERTAEEETVVLRVKSNRGHELYMLEAAKTFLSRDVPQSYLKLGVKIKILEGI